MSNASDSISNNITTREETNAKIVELCEQIKNMFSNKNKSYGNDADGFYNFRETARRIFFDTNPSYMLDVIMVYMDKHWVALTQNGIYTPECKERFMDMAVYSLLSIALLETEGGNLCSG